MKRYVFYHGNCVDGFTSAWVAHRMFLDEAEYVPLSYGDPVPDIEKGSDVYILDFSWPVEDLENILERCSSLHVMDHHISAEKHLKKFSESNKIGKVIFDNDRSGAKIAWNHFFPGTFPPALVEYVEDHDLWRHALPHSSAVTSYIRTFPFEFPKWEFLSHMLIYDFDEAIGKGEAVMDFTERVANEHAARAHMITLLGREVPYVNATFFQSEIGHALLDKYPDAPFAVSSMNVGDKVVVSLRSEDNREDVSKIAQEIYSTYSGCVSGGGHRNAAGATFKTTKMPSFFYEDGTDGVDRISEE